ncbi:MAG: helix-turn-helix transcriptional regulator [Desulfovibrionaceae bacterium]|nr:helix-turn-helix transcriptional regulator [Desulfovibrionaceae bacterium]
MTEKPGGRIQVEEETIVVPPMPQEERPGRMLKGLRLREGLTQAFLAKAVGVPQSHISAYEKNTRPIPKDKAEKLAEILHSVPENFQ